MRGETGTGAAILALLVPQGVSMTVGRMTQKLGANRSTVGAMALRLVMEGRLVRTETQPHRYSLSPEARATAEAAVATEGAQSFAAGLAVGRAA